jgi:biopolymer transport protein ExbD
MGRFRNLGDDNSSESGIDISPLIDCVFILLIFFIVTTTFVEETGVEVDKPQAASAVQLEKTSILIALTAKGEVVYGGREIGISGVQPLVKRMLQKEDVPGHFSLAIPKTYCS